MELIYEGRIKRTVLGCEKIRIEAWATGRPDDRGEILLEVDSYDGSAADTFSPKAARKLAEVLLELADKAERFSTRGFVGSKE